MSFDVYRTTSHISFIKKKARMSLTFNFLLRRSYHAYAAVSDCRSPLNSLLHHLLSNSRVTTLSSLLRHALQAHLRVRQGGEASQSLERRRFTAEINRGFVR